MAKRVFCIGNGESRKDFDLEKLRSHGKIYGCNALYRDFTPDHLSAVDAGIMHEIYNSGYCQNNPTLFRDWNRLPGHMYENLLWAGKKYSDQEYELIKNEEAIKSNERGDCQEFVMHGSNLAGVVEILKKNKEREKRNINHTSIHVSWVTNDDKVTTINEIMERDRGWATGATSGYAACHYEKPDELFLIGHDLESLTGNLNNVYKDTKYYGLSAAHKTPSVNWRSQWQKLISENPHTTFYKVNPYADTGKDQVSITIEEWRNLKNLKYISFEALDNMLKI
jgi:hypothetical protein